MDQNLFELEIYHDKDLKNIVEEKEIIPMNQTLYGKVIPKEGYSVIYSLYEFSFYHEYDDYASYILDDDHPSIYMWDIKIVPAQDNYQDVPLKDEDYSFSLHNINKELIFWRVNYGDTGFGGVNNPEGKAIKKRTH